jgi:hypothetical protein
VKVIILNFFPLQNWCHQKTSEALFISTLFNAKTIHSTTTHYKHQYYSSWHCSLTSMYLHIILFYISLYKHLRASTLIFLKCMVNEHVSMNLVSLSKKLQPSLVLRLDKIMRVVGISITHTLIEMMRVIRGSVNRVWIT